MHSSTRHDRDVAFGAAIVNSQMRLLEAPDISVQVCRNSGTRGHVVLRI